MKDESLQERLTFGPVHLDVQDSARSQAFWQEVIGLVPWKNRLPDSLTLGTDERPLVVLHPGATRLAPRGFSGLYHVAIHVPTELALAQTLARLLDQRQRVATVDHLLSKALYLSDPDGIGIEFTLETPERGKLLGVNSQGFPLLVDTHGHPHSGREHLDIRALLATQQDKDPARTLLLPQGTKIGHIHLHVRDLDEAYHFHRDQVGFLDGHLFAGFGMAELQAGGQFQHRLALNIWQGQGAPPHPAGHAGLRHFTVIPTPGLGLDNQAERWLRDPSGNTLHITNE